MIPGNGFRHRIEYGQNRQRTLPAKIRQEKVRRDAGDNNEIGAGAFIGSNSSLVAPVAIGAGAYVGSGSVITKNVDADDLAGRQMPVRVAEEALRRLHEEQRVDNFEAPFRDRAGRSVPGLTSARLVEIDGEPCSLVITRDLSDLEEARREWRRSEERYHMLFVAANDAIFLMDGECFQDCNPKTLEIFGCEREDIIGAPPYRFSPERQPDGSASVSAAKERIGRAFAGDRLGPRRVELVANAVGGGEVLGAPRVAALFEE